MIYSDSAKCRFCSEPLDQQAALAGAELQRRTNDACNQAKWIRNIAGAMWVFWLVGLIVGVVRLAFLGCLFLVPISAIVWIIKYGSLETADPDYKRARREILIATLLWIPALALQLLSIALLFV